MGLRSYLRFQWRWWKWFVRYPAFQFNSALDPQTKYLLLARYDAAEPKRRRR
jgi:hypothetical protein